GGGRRVLREQRRRRIFAPPVAGASPVRSYLPPVIAPPVVGPTPSAGSKATNPSSSGLPSKSTVPWTRTRPSPHPVTSNTAAHASPSSACRRDQPRSVADNMSTSDRASKDMAGTGANHPDRTGPPGALPAWGLPIAPENFASLGRRQGAPGDQADSVGDEADAAISLEH